MTVTTFDTKLGQQFEKLLREEIANLSLTIIGGLLSHDDYRFWCGQIRGLEEALKILQEAQTKLTKGD